MLPNRQGWAVHDGLKAYFGFTTVRYAHHLRELQPALEQYMAHWVQSLAMKRLRERDNLATNTLNTLGKCYDTLLKLGFEAFPIQPRPPNSSKREHPVVNLLIRLHDYRDAVLAFLHHPEVPFDNNLAERDLRMMQVKQNISGCFRIRARQRSSRRCVLIWLPLANS